MSFKENIKNLSNTISKVYTNIKDALNYKLEPATPEKINEFMSYCKEKDLSVIVDKEYLAIPQVSDCTFSTGSTLGITHIELRTDEKDYKNISLVSEVYTPGTLVTANKDLDEKLNILLGDFQNKNIKYKIVEDK